MDITIPLPENSMANTYKKLNHFLKQLELAVHHAQKAVENAEKSGIEVTEDSYISYEYSSLDTAIKLEKDKEINLENFMDNFWEDLQRPELKIHLA